MDNNYSTTTFNRKDLNFQNFKIFTNDFKGMLLLFAEFGLLVFHERPIFLEDPVFKCFLISLIFSGFAIKNGLCFFGKLLIDLLKNFPNEPRNIYLSHC